MILDKCKGRLIARFDCNSKLSNNDFYCSDGLKIAQSEIGTYWETNGELNSEFGFKFKIENLDKPHLMRFAYPDDKKRYMGVSDCISYDMSTAVSTGGVYPFSNKMQIVEKVFWSRYKESNVSFVTMNVGNPAAIAWVEIYELEGLPVVEDLPIDKEFRRIGIQFEDPCGRCGDLGALSLKKWNERLIEYMKSSGVNELYYPVNWYHGPIFPSKTQPADFCDWIMTEDRRNFSRCTTTPPDWVEDILDSFDKENLFFTASFTLSRLGTLLANRQEDEDAIKNGADTYNNVRANNRVQNAINDWTIVYNARNYKKLIERAKENDGVIDFRGIDLAYGERMSDIGIGPMFNPLHPTVQNTIKEYLKEFAERYKSHTSLRCLSMNVWHSSLFWFGRLDFGYDDYTVGLFEKENGIVLNVDKTDGERFSKRYEVLVNEYKELWIDWRCRKIAEFIKELTQEIKSVNPNVKFALNFWNEMVKPCLIGIHAGTQLYARSSDYQFLREAGIDIKLLGQIEGVEICIENNHQRDITCLFGEGDIPLERGFMFRDHDFMDDERNENHKSCLNPSAFIFNCWHESWGKVNITVDFNESELPNYVTSYDDNSKPEVMYENRSDKHNDQFWYDWQIVIVSAFPPNPYYLEYYAHSLADIDAINISAGGLYVDTTHTEEILAFAKEYRNLPAVKFDDLNCVGDPITVRYKYYNNKLYIYAVNKSPVQASVRIELDKFAEITRPANNAQMQSKSICADLDAFELRVYTLDKEVNILSCTMESRDEKAQLLINAGNQALKLLQESKQDIKGTQETASKLKKALELNKYGEIYHILTGYIVSQLKKENKNNDRN